jgi:hypothetical protein
MPSLCFLENGDTYQWQSENLLKIIYGVTLFVYTDVGMDPDVVPSIVMNNCLDAIDAVLVPDYNECCTLGRLVSSVRIVGDIIKVPGDLDGKGLAVIPLQILLP